MATRLIIALALCLSLCGLALAQENATGPAPAQMPETVTLTLKQAVAKALEHNHRLLAYQHRAVSADDNIMVAWSTLLPHASAGLGWTKIKNPNNTSERDVDYIDQYNRSKSIQVQQNLFDGLGRINGLLKAKLLKVRADQELRRTELETVLSVQTEFLKLARVRADAKAYEAASERLKGQKAAAEAFYRLMLAPRLTILQNETALAQNEQRLSRARSDELIQLAKLKALLGANGQELDYSGDLGSFAFTTPLALEECLKQALQRLPEAIIAQKDVEIASKELGVSASRFFPKVDASGAYIQQDYDYKQSNAIDTHRKYYTAGVNVSWEFFSSGETTFDTKSKWRLLDAAKEELENTKMNIYSMVKESYQNVQEARNQIRLARLRQQEAKEAYDQAMMRFRSSVGTSIDLLDAQEKVTTADAAFNQAQADYLTSLASLYRYMGEKNESLSELP